MHIGRECDALAGGEQRPLVARRGAKDLHAVRRGVLVPLHDDDVDGREVGVDDL